MAEQDKSCVDCIIHVGVVTVQLLVLQHKSWFELRFQEVLSIYPPPLAACGAPSKDIFLTRIFPAYGAPSRSVEQCNQSSCLRFLAKQNIHPTNKGGDGTGLRSTVQEV